MSATVLHWVKYDTYIEMISVFILHSTVLITNEINDQLYFKLALKRYLLHYSFYSLEEYFNT